MKAPSVNDEHRCLGHIAALLMAAAMACVPSHDFTEAGPVFASASDVQGIRAFNIPNWSGTEPHNGIDMLVDPALARARVISPVDANVSSIRTSENPYSNPPGDLLLSVELYVNPEWSAVLVFEPVTADAGVKTAQRDAILVHEGDEVVTGSDIGDLLVGTPREAHVHYMLHRNGSPVCAYAFSSAAAKAQFDQAADAGVTTGLTSLPDGRLCYGQ